MKDIRHTVVIEKLTTEGYGFLQLNGMDFYVIGALPGETVEIRVIKKRKGRRWAIVENVIESDVGRIPPLEDHFVSCSPWQVFPYPKQLELKENMLKQAFLEEAGLDVEAEVPERKFFGATPLSQTTGYRTKVEMNFWYEDNFLYLAFHKRGTPFVLTPLTKGCILASKSINETSLKVIQLINEHKIPKSDLKSLTIRESKTKDCRIALLCVKRKDFTLPFSLEDIPGLAGLVVAYSDPLSPASLITEILDVQGQDYLEEDIDGLQIRYPIDGFFQNNISLFGKALKIMQDVVKSLAAGGGGKSTVTTEGDAGPNCDSEKIGKIVELYSGVGTIGLALCKQAKEVTGVEVVPSSIELAKENALRNNITNYTCFALPAEKMDSSVLADVDVLVLDPPRTGLHADVVNYILEHAPKTILYLSCNPVTQARDYALLKGKYSPTALYGFDFYPQTMHMESLVVLNLIP